MLNELLDALGVAGNVIDTPGSIARGLLAGNADAAFGGIMDPSRRISGRGLLENYGLLNQKQEGEGFDFGDALGIGAGMLTDPMMYLGGAGLASKFLGGGAKAARAAGTAIAPVAEEAASSLGALRNARQGFAMAKGVVPGEIGAAGERLVGGTVADKINAATNVADTLKDTAASQLRSGMLERTQGLFDPNLNAGAILKGAAPEVPRHEIIHGIINNATQTGNTEGLPMMMRIPANLERFAGGADGVTGGMADVMNELAAHSLENRGMLNQIKGAGRFLLGRGPAHDFYASEFAKRSPLIGALYGQLPNAPAALGAAGALGGGTGLIYANANQER